jgi:GntR family transcriptional repressor for pyruvate dehydrogenase complex
MVRTTETRVTHLMSHPTAARTAISAVDNVIASVLTIIVDNRLDDGATIPAEGELADRFTVSRLTVREAMKVLTALGVVTVQRGRGTFVNPRSEWSRFHPAVLASLAHSPADAAETSRHLIEARRLVEVGVAELAAERRDDEHLAALEQTLEMMWHAHETADYEAWASADLAFHDTLMEAAGNPFVTVLFTPLEELLRRDRHEPAAEAHHRRRALTWHQRILDAVRAGHPAGARAAMDGHLRDTQEILAEWNTVATGVNA